jgi:hypothetical protein
MLPSARRHLEDALGCFTRLKDGEAQSLVVEARAIKAEISPPPAAHPPVQDQNAGWFNRLFG